MPFACLPVRRMVGAGVVLAALAAAAPAGAQSSLFGPEATDLIKRLCDKALRTNEEDRLYGMISNAVRATIRYRGAPFQPDLVDDAVQASLDALIEECPEFAASEQSKRLNMAIEIISDQTTKALATHRDADKDKVLRKQVERMTAADLSQELSSQEIDQWLDSLPPRERALTLFLYSDVTPRDIAAAIGEPPGALARQFTASKTDLLRVFREERDALGAPHAGPSIEYHVVGQGMAALVTPGAAPPPPAAADNPAAPVGEARRDLASDGAPAMRVTGISSDLYAGWSLLAIVKNLPRGQSIDVRDPFLLEPDTPGLKRMLVVGAVELGKPRGDIRRFLLKAYAVDADKDAAGLADSFHLSATKVDNLEVNKTLGNPSLSSIEIARCLWFDFGTGPDPGLCR